MPAPRVTDTQIAEAAYLIWQAEGRPHGRDADHWHQAVATLKAQTRPTPKKKAPAKAAKPRARKA